MQWKSNKNLYVCVKQKAEYDQVEPIAMKMIEYDIYITERQTVVWMVIIYHQ